MIRYCVCVCVSSVSFLNFFIKTVNCIGTDGVFIPIQCPAQGLSNLTFHLESSFFPRVDDNHITRQSKSSSPLIFPFFRLFYSRQNLQIFHTFALALSFFLILQGFRVHLLWYLPNDYHSLPLPIITLPYNRVCVCVLYADVYNCVCVLFRQSILLFLETYLSLVCM